MRAIRDVAKDHAGTTARPQPQRHASPAPHPCTDEHRAFADAGVCGVRWRGYSFGVAHGAAREEAAALLARLYGRCGYRCERTPRTADALQRLPLAGKHGSRLFATLTLGLDGPNGLLADELYRHEIDAFRTDERKVCELSAFAVDPAYSAHGVLVSLFRLAYLYGRLLHRVTDAFIEVNPRHVGFYERIMGFERCGEQRICPRVGAPAVLMHLDAAAAGSP